MLISTAQNAGIGCNTIYPGHYNGRGIFLGISLNFVVFLSSKYSFIFYNIR